MVKSSGEVGNDMKTAFINLIIVGVIQHYFQLLPQRRLWFVQGKLKGMKIKRPDAVNSWEIYNTAGWYKWHAIWFYDRTWNCRRYNHLDTVLGRILVHKEGFACHFCRFWDFEQGAKRFLIICFWSVNHLRV